jgi:hypothetical protein
MLVCLLVVFGGVFVVRGPMRAMDNAGDLAHLYAAASLFVQGGNPYDGSACVEVMRQAGQANPEAYANGSFYPPPTIATLAPVGLLPWPLAKLAWLLVNAVATTVLLWSLHHWLAIGDPRLRWLTAAVLLAAWGPIATAFSLGQLSVASAACAFAALVLLERNAKAVALAGPLLAISCLVKPQLGLGFLLLIVLRREWQASAIALGVIGVVTAVAIARLTLIDPAWSAMLVENVTRDQSTGNVLDASPAGALRYQMIDIRPLLHYVLPGAWVNLSAVLLVIAMTGVALARLLRAGLKRHALLAAAGVGLLVLMPVYHRYYDAVLLLPLLALAINALLRNRGDRLMLVIAAAMLPLFVPMPALLSVLHAKGIVPEALHASWPWQGFVLQVHSWCLLIAAVALVVWTYRHADRAKPAER